MEALHNFESLRVSGEETFCFFETRMPGRGLSPRSPTLQAGSFHHCTRPHPPPSHSTNVLCYWEEMASWAAQLTQRQTRQHSRHCGLHNILYLSTKAVLTILGAFIVGYERVYLPLSKVADTPFHIQGDDLRLATRKGQ